MRYTEYHAGKAVIRDKELLSQAMEKLAKIEDMKDIPSTICDKYCKYPDVCGETSFFCDNCAMTELFKILEDEDGEKENHN